MTEKIENEIKIKAKQITNELISFMSELDTEANRQIKELKLDIEFYKSELAKKADTNHSLVEQMADLESENADQKDQLTTAKEIIKKLLDTQYCLDPYRDIFKERVAEAEQFLSEVDNEKTDNSR